MRFIAQQLRRLFLDHDCVVVPGLGGFVFHALPARYDSAALVLHPPGREVVFNPRLIHNDGVLAHALVVHAGMTYASALAAVEEEAAAMRRELTAGGTVVLDGVGRLYREEGVVRFVADAELEWILRSYGLQRLPLAPLVPQRTLVEPIVAASEVLGVPEIPVVPFRRRLLRAAAVLALPATVGGALWLSSGASGEQFGWTVAPVDAVSSYIPRFSVEALTLPAPHTEAVFADAWPSDADELRFHFRSEQVSDHGVRIVRSPSAPVPAVSAEPITQEESPRAAAVDAFEVVIGAFAQTANADRLASRLEQQGQPARTALRSDGLTLVVWGGYADAAAAEAGLAAAADAGFTGAWVRRIP
jgi:hypothetical protein